MPASTARGDGWQQAALYQTCWLNVLSQYGARDAPACTRILLGMNAERERVEDVRPPPNASLHLHRPREATAAAAAIARRYRDTACPYINAERVAAPRRRKGTSASTPGGGLGRVFGQTFAVNLHNNVGRASFAAHARSKCLPRVSSPRFHVVYHDTPLQAPGVRVTPAGQTRRNVAAESTTSQSADRHDG